MSTHRNTNLASAPRRAAFVFLYLLVLSGCAVRLAPSYDKSIVNGLEKANVETLTLFASVSDGAKPGTYAKREETYNKIIGQFDALRSQVAARPEPRSFLADWLGSDQTKVSTKSDIKKIELLKGPSEEILTEIINTLTRMRKTDKKGTLDKNKMTGEGGFPNSYKISFHQVLTYEKSLER